MFTRTGQRFTRGQTISNAGLRTTLFIPVRLCHWRWRKFELLLTAGLATRTGEWFRARRHNGRKIGVRRHSRRRIDDTSAATRGTWYGHSADGLQAPRLLLEEHGGAERRKPPLQFGLCATIGVKLCRRDVAETGRRRPRRYQHAAQLAGVGRQNMMMKAYRA